MAPNKHKTSKTSYQCRSIDVDSTLFYVFVSTGCVLLTFESVIFSATEPTARVYDADVMVPNKHKTSKGVEMLWCPTNTKRQKPSYQRSMFDVDLRFCVYWMYTTNFILSAPEATARV